MTVHVDEVEPLTRDVIAKIVPNAEHFLVAKAAVGPSIDVSDEQRFAEKLAEDPSYNPDKMFYADFEQAAAGHTEYGTGPLMRLDEEWNGHPVDSLVFLSYEGLDEDPAVYTLFVENPEGG